MAIDDWVQIQGRIEVIGAWLRDTLDYRTDWPCGNCDKTFNEHPGVDFNGRPTGIIGPLFLCVEDVEGQVYQPSSARPAPDTEAR